MSLPARTQATCEPLDRQQIDDRLKGCDSLPSLGSIDTALKDLLGSDQRYTSQIAEIIRRDPSLTARLLKLVNSVFYGFPKPVRSIEDAVFYVGVRQIRQLALVTSIVDDMQKLAANRHFPWREFWRHCVATALMTREVMDVVKPCSEDSDYVSGLIHDVGKIVMATTFPDHFLEIYQARKDSGVDLLAVEREVLGMDHAELGSIYLKKQLLPENLVEIVQFHHQPELSKRYSDLAASVQVADLLVRGAGIGKSGNTTEIKDGDWETSSGCKILFGWQTEAERDRTRIVLKRHLQRMPAIVAEML